MIDKIPSKQKESLFVTVFFVIITSGLSFYSTQIGTTVNSSSIIIAIPLLLGFTLPSKVLSIVWKTISVFLCLMITACYFGVAWPQRWVLGSDGYYEIVNASGLFPYVNYICIISILYVAIVIYYKIKIKKVTAYD